MRIGCDLLRMQYFGYLAKINLHFAFEAMVLTNPIRGADIRYQGNNTRYFVYRPSGVPWRNGSTLILEE